MKRFLNPNGPEPKRPALSLNVVQPTSDLVGSLESRSVSRNSDRSFSCPEGVDISELTCYGSICSLPFQVRSDPLASFRESHTSRNDQKTHIILAFTFRGDYCWAGLLEGEPFGCLTAKASLGLKRLRHFSCVEIECAMPFDSIEKARSAWRKSGRSAMSTLDVNIYGHAHSAQQVGRTLSSAKLFLQPPDFDLRSLTYDNPQYLKLPGVAHIPALSSDIAFNVTSQEANAEATSSEIEAILDHIPQPSFLKEVNTDGRIVTPLAKHQKEAVDFITRRETGNLPPSMSLWKPHCTQSGSFCFQHVITGAKNSEMDDVTGGILADDMGLGKTLSMLAVIVESLSRALNFAFTNTRGALNHWQDIIPSRATLVIVPSSLLLDSWVEEIQKHIAPGTISVHRYHASGKRIDLACLLKYDVVLTTYATVAADFCRGQSMLNRVQWYRVVLDEAHVIRNYLTKQFRAIHALPARVRWCLTGTPIQNVLEDLGTLLKVLRVPILEDMAIFRKYIAVPVHSKTSGRFTHLRRLLEALCLRRTKSLLNLPDPVTHLQRLELSALEMEAYHDFNENCKRAIDLAVSGHSMKKANRHVIQAILGMRLFCNNGPTAFVGKVYPYGIPSDPEEALSYFQTCGKAMCVLCDCEILTMYQADDRSSGVLTSCHHLIHSGECLSAFEADLDDNVQLGRTECPVCGVRDERDSFIIKPPQVSKAETTEQKSYPTKTLKLLSNVRSQDVNDKCVIFSYWKKTLDIVAELFEANDIAFYRIDGSLLAGRRSKILSEFEQRCSARVLLATLGTGAVGINKLKVANHIHIMEPQWNPSVESQAIGRVLRLGQERTVTIIRYIMKDTVEEAVQSKQLRKLQLACGGFGMTKDEHSTQRIQEVMSLLCPSRRPDISTVMNNVSQEEVQAG